MSCFFFFTVRGKNYKAFNSGRLLANKIRVCANFNMKQSHFLTNVYISGGKKVAPISETVEIDEHQWQNLSHIFSFN